MITIKQLDEVKVGDWFCFDIALPLNHSRDWVGYPKSPDNFSEYMAPLLDYKPRKIVYNKRDGRLGIEGIEGIWNYCDFVDHIHIHPTNNCITTFDDDSIIRVEVEREVDCIILS